MNTGPHNRLSPGKYRRLGRLADADGRFAMLAVDQRGSLLRMLEGREKGISPAEGLRLVKRVVTSAVAPLTTAVLTDPLYGLDASFDVIPPDAGLLLSLEQTGYEAAGEAERLSRLIDGWTVERILRRGADAVKLLIWHHPDASAATHRHQQEIVAAVGSACGEAEMPFVLEVVTYSLEDSGTKGVSFDRLKSTLVADAAGVYSAPCFGVDMLKLEFPSNLKYVEEYQHAGFAAGEARLDLAGVEDACREVNERAECPWVILSGGVDPEEFAENLRLANKAGASGFLCGRAVWKRVVDSFPDEIAMTDFMRTRGRAYFKDLVEANAGALPWHQHRRFSREAAASPANHSVFEQDPTH